MKLKSHRKPNNKKVLNINENGLCKQLLVDWINSLTKMYLELLYQYSSFSGYLRDSTGDYNMSFHLLGSTSIAAATLLLIFQPLLHQCRSDTESTDDLDFPEEKESLAE